MEVGLLLSVLDQLVVVEGIVVEGLVGWCKDVSCFCRRGSVCRCWNGREIVERRDKEEHGLSEM